MHACAGQSANVRPFAQARLMFSSAGRYLGIEEGTFIPLTMAKYPLCVRQASSPGKPNMSKEVTPSKILQRGQGDGWENYCNTACEGLRWSTYKMHGRRDPEFRKLPLI